MFKNPKCSILDVNAFSSFRAAAARSAPAPGANAGRARHAGGASATAVETSPRRRSDARLSAAGSPGRWRTGGDRSIRWSSLFVSFFPPERRGKKQNKTKQQTRTKTKRKTALFHRKLPPPSAGRASRPGALEPSPEPRTLFLCRAS